MTGCLYECLQEARLERYHAHFVRHGIAKCEGLAALSMQDYSHFGITHMEDRVRLFKLVQIVKSVQSEGRFCKHEAPAVPEAGARRPVPQCLPTQDQARTRGQAFVQYLQSKSSTRSGDELGVSEQGWHRVANYDPKPIPKPESVMAPMKKRPIADPVKFRPGTGSPIFKCRKVLTFSDCESDEEEEEVDTASSITDSEIRQKVLSTIPDNLLKLQQYDKQQQQYHRQQQQQHHNQQQQQQPHRQQQHHKQQQQHHKQQQQKQPVSYTTDGPVSKDLRSSQWHEPIKVNVEPPKSFFIEVTKNSSKNPAQNIQAKPVVRETLFGFASNMFHKQGFQQCSGAKVVNVAESPPQKSRQRRIVKHNVVEDGTTASMEPLKKINPSQVSRRQETVRSDSESDLDTDEYFELPHASHIPQKVVIPQVQSFRRLDSEAPSLHSHSQVVQASTEENTNSAQSLRHEPLRAVTIGQQTQSIEFPLGQVAPVSAAPTAESIRTKITEDGATYNPAKYSPSQHHQHHHHHPQSSAHSGGISVRMESDQKLLRPATATALPVNIGARPTEFTSQLAVPKSALFRDARQRARRGEEPDHAYFPTAKAATPTSKEPVVERVVHSADYNYGVPTAHRPVDAASPGKYRAANRAGAQRIRVCVRKRPLTRREQKRQEVDVVRADSDDTIMVDETKVAIDLAKYVQQHVYVFDEVFDETKSNKDVYASTAKPLVKHIFNRGCATCFAFGQTGAGKTYTLLGTPTVPGLYRLAAADMLSLLHSAQYGPNLHLWVSYYEIYCSQLYDLLNKRKKLYVRENGRQRVCIAGLMETRVRNVDDVTQVVQYGNSVRSTGSTGVNPSSSRSHAILQLEIRDSRDQRLGRLSFIDLAGSERASDVTEFDRQTRIEGAEINQSLLAPREKEAHPGPAISIITSQQEDVCEQLRRSFYINCKTNQLKECIRALDQESKHTPYRQSKLTHILRDSFVGNSQTCMIANISPSLSACENTLNTLRYADRVKELRKTTPSNVAHVSVPAETPTGRPGVNATLFHPSNIQFASTPKQEQERGPRALALTLQQDSNETPIRGHKIKKTPERQKIMPSQKLHSPSSPVKTSPFEFKVERNGNTVSIQTFQESKLRGRSSVKKLSPQQNSGSKPSAAVYRSPPRSAHSTASEQKSRNSSSKKSPCSNENSCSAPHLRECHQQHNSEKAYYRGQKSSYRMTDEGTDTDSYSPLKIPTAIDKLSMIGSDEKPKMEYSAAISPLRKHHQELKPSPQQSRGNFIKDHRQILNHLDNIMGRAKTAIEESASPKNSPQNPSSSSPANEKNSLSSLQSGRAVTMSLIHNIDELQRYDEVIAKQSALYDLKSSHGERPTLVESEPVKKTFHALKEDTDTTEDNLDDDDDENDDDNHMPDGHHFSPQRDDDSDTGECQLHSPLGSLSLEETIVDDEKANGTSQSQSQATSDGEEYCSCNSSNHARLAKISRFAQADTVQQTSVDKHHSGSSERSVAPGLDTAVLSQGVTPQQSSRTQSSSGSSRGNALGSPLMAMHHSNHDISSHVDTIRQLLYEEIPASTSSGVLPIQWVPLSADATDLQTSFSCSTTGQIEQRQKASPAKGNESSDQVIGKHEASLSHRLPHAPSSDFLQSLADIKVCYGGTLAQQEIDDQQARLSRVNPALARIGQSFKSPNKRIFPDHPGYPSSNRKSSSFQPYHSTKHGGAKEIAAGSVAANQNFSRCDASTFLSSNTSAKPEVTHDSGISSTQIEAKALSEPEPPFEWVDAHESEPLSFASTMDGVVSLSAQLEEDSRCGAVQTHHLQLEQVVHQQSLEQPLLKEVCLKSKLEQKLLKHHSLEEIVLSGRKGEQAMDQLVKRPLSDMDKHAVDHAQQTFMPIHPQPTTTMASHVIVPAGVIASAMTPTPQAEEAKEAEEAEDKVLSKVIVAEESNTCTMNVIPSLTIPDEETKSCSSAISSARSNTSAVQKSQNLVLIAHEDQLAEITSVCKQEMRLLVAVQSGEKTFDEYIQATEGLLTSKAAAISTLRAHVSAFRQHPVLGSTGNTPR